MSMRKYLRERKEYLYRKSLEKTEREEYERKTALKRALADGKPVPTELKSQYNKLTHTILADDDDTETPHNTVDDEYARAGIEDPKIYITTSRDPSSRLSQFTHEMKLFFPNSQKVNRGNHMSSQIVRACIDQGVTDLIFLHENRGEPDGMIISHLPFGPTMYFGISNCVLRHDIENVESMSLQYPHLIFENFSTKLGERTMSALKYLFPVPKSDSTRTVTFVNQDDWISFRHHVFEKRGTEIVLKEVGPRFELRLYKIVLGTIDQKEAEVEWALRPFMRTAKKRNFL